MTAYANTTIRHLGKKIVCTLFGHQVDNHRFAQASENVKQCPCGVEILHQDSSETRVRHTVSCFLIHHRYIKMSTRNGHNDYVCIQCGHPLLFEIGNDPYSKNGGRFDKKARYLCNLFGHKVHTVTKRNSYTEYACFCGHSFLKQEKSLSKVTHPLICLFAGHFIHFEARRNGYAEFVCRNCGHTFCFVDKN